MPDSLREKLLNSVELVDDPSEFSDDDFRWGETRGNKVYINHRKFQEAGAENYQDKMLLGESLHLLKEVDPDRYKRMEQAALHDPDYLDWAHDSYNRSKEEYGESRDFWSWHRESRFDQIIGGYLFAGDKSIPTMKGWDRDKLPWGRGLRKELESLSKELEIE